MFTTEATPHHQSDFLTCMSVQVHGIPSNIKHNETESFGVTEGEISSKLPLLLNTQELGAEREAEKKTNTYHHLNILTWYGSFP